VVATRIWALFFQISIDKGWVVSGAYQNVLSGEKSPISGQVDKATQRVAWKIGSNNTIIETGLQNLTKPLWRFICRPAQDHPAGAQP
jgi:hypothetical protein